ncbi:discoidin domain-containing protein [Paenibacillus macquariensis]|uniref:Cohesin domain-containing protein n=1 Tax=Paenibacillus macquariensis TaxID=948756 RepID=A0ABY1JJB9_9BACL|nr:discoidin domain-containing protein [Paenibacillus macquariensis]MEC0089690.1 discoidin domain-containing protein [Paenibacillus macquariensis]OAB30831.1 hypothetical protein PMSM_22095 [Paenibacillus macquariensis subsp. macquariensis]SIQ28874.1 Cohesin domain-containing protein [Paenibacillus macquariensis]
MRINRTSKRLIVTLCLLIIMGFSNGLLLKGEIVTAAEVIQDTSLLDQSKWLLKSVDSEELQSENGKAINTFDGNPATFWHSKYYGAIAPLPHSIDINLGGTHEMRGFRYLPRQVANANGAVKNYELYVSMDGENWGVTPVASGTFANSITEKEVLFANPVIGNHIRFVALSEMKGQQFTTVAELNLLQTTENTLKHKVLQVDQSAVTLEVGQTQKLNVTWKYGADVTKEVTNVVKYTSLDSDVATVSSKGLITARNKGKTTIQIKHGDAEPVNVSVTIDTGVANSGLTVTQNGDSIIIGNWYMDRVFNITGNKVITKQIVNKSSGETANVKAGEEFIIHLDNSTRLQASDLTLSTWEVLDGEGGSKTLVFRFAPKNQITVSLFVAMNPDDHFMRKHLEIQSENPNFTVSRIELESLDIPGPFWSTPVSGRMGFGQPVYANDLFFGVEFPGADNKLVSQKVVSAYSMGNPQVGATTLTSKTSVSGVSARQEEVRARCLAYVDTIALPARFQLQYNGWFELYHDANSANLIKTYKEIEKGMSSYGVRPLDVYAADDGWADYNKGFWDFNTATFPNGFSDQAKLLKNYGSKFGVWLGPAGGYKSPGTFSARLKKEYGYETVGSYMDVTGPKYTQALKQRMMDLTEEYDINYWKLDGFVLVDNEVTSQPAYFTRFWDTWIDIFQDLREDEKDIFLNITTGSNNSPWLLPYVNSVWLNIGTDAGYRGTGSDRDQMLTYVDYKYYTRFKVEQSQMPLRYIYNHEPIHGIYVKNPAGRDYTQTLEEFRKYLFMCLVRGTGFVEVYYSPSLFDDAQWKVNAEVLTWAEENFDALSNADMIGGNPLAGDVYGYSGWTKDKGIVSLRNPSSTAKTYQLTLDTLLGLKDKTKSYYRTTVYPYGASEEGPFEYGETFTITLQPYEAFVYQFESSDDEEQPTIAQVSALSSNQIEVLFSERMKKSTVENIANYSLNNGVSVVSAVLGEDYKSVILTVAGLSRGTPYKLTVNNMLDMADNAIASNASQSFYRADGGLVAHWEFTEQDGIAAADSSGNGNEATIHQATHVDGELFNALQFNGTSSSVEAGAASSISSTGDMALSVRVKTSATTEQVIIQQGSASAAEGQYQLKLKADGHVQWQMKDKGTEAGFLAVSDTAVNDGEWHHIIVVRENNGLGKIYVDRVLDGSDYSPLKVDLQPASVYIGTAGIEHAQYFNGLIGDVQLFNRSVPYNEVELMESEEPGFLAQSSWKLHYADSQQTAGEDGKATNAFDGNPNTYWHTKHSPADPMPHDLQIDLGQTNEMSGFVYSPRKQMNGSNYANGIIKDYKFYVSMDGVNWGDPVATGTFASDNTDKEVKFNGSVIGRYIRLVALSEINGQAYTSVAELNILQTKHNLSKKSLKVIKPAIVLTTGGTEQLEVNWQLGTLLKKDLTANVTYTSDNLEIATVNTQGLVTAKGDGTTTIRITYEGLEPIVVTVTVGIQQKVTTVLLTGPKSVVAGEKLEVQYGLNNVTQNVYAQDITINYDPSAMDFISAKSLIEGVSLVETQSSTPGKIRMIIASTGEGHAVTGNAQIVELSFVAKEVAVPISGKLSSSDVTLADNNGVEEVVAATEITIEVTPGTVDIPGDINKDGKVSIGDLAIVAANYGKDSTSPDWAKIKQADVNKDGIIDLTDLAAVASKIVE